MSGTKSKSSIDRRRSGIRFEVQRGCHNYPGTTMQRVIPVSIDACKLVALQETHPMALGGTMIVPRDS